MTFTSQRIEAFDQSITAVVHGYCQQRKPGAAELSVPEEAVLL
jgi:hypothetical protein